MDAPGWFVHKNSPGVGIIAKEPTWTSDVDYLTQNNRSLQSYACFLQLFPVARSTSNVRVSSFGKFFRLREIGSCTRFSGREVVIAIGIALPKCDARCKES